MSSSLPLKYTHPTLAVLLITLPLELSDAEGDETNLSVIGGGGQYARITRGCSGNVLSREKSSFSEIGGQVDHKFVMSPKIGRYGIADGRTGGIRLGIRASQIRFNHFIKLQIDGNFVSQNVLREVTTINPFIHLESSSLNFGVGYFWSSRPLPAQGDGEIDPAASFFFRADVRSVYLSFSYLSHMPLVANGYAYLGIGSDKPRNIDWWLGLSGAPQDHLGLLAKIDIRLVSNLHLNLVGRIGQSEQISEHAWSLGLSYRFRGGR